MARNDLAAFQEFREALGTRDPKTIATYLTTMRGFVACLSHEAQVERCSTWAS